LYQELKRFTIIIYIIIKKNDKEFYFFEVSPDSYRWEGAGYFSNYGSAKPSNKPEPELQQEIFMKTALLLAGILLIFYAHCTQKTVTDADGNRYPTVKIGSQVWTAENLRTTRFNDGSPIPLVTGNSEWHVLASPGFCYFGNTTNADSIATFGALYNWYCIDTKKLAPPGWHVPTDDDWDTLQHYLIRHGYNWDGKRSENRIAKSLAAKSGWKPFTIEGAPGNNMKDNNRSGFSGFAAGYRYDTRDSVEGTAPWKAAFSAMGHKAAWWSATPVNESTATVYGLGFCVDDFLQYRSFFKTCGHSVRLVKNKR
jgi:uncharacterized protein (TIGR02145 family)